MEPNETQPAVEGTDGLHLALMRRSLNASVIESEQCDVCGRRLLLGERVYEYSDGANRCALCQGQHGGESSGVHQVHGPSFGRTIKIIDRRPRARVA